MSEKSIGENKEITRNPRIIDRRSYLKTVGATGGGLALGGIGLSESGIESARAATTIIDDFEDGDLSEYEHDKDFDGRASIASSPTYEGSYSVEISAENAELISKSGLNAYPGEGDTFSFWVRASGGADNLNVTWGVQGHDDRYYAKLKPASDSFYLFTYKNESGSSQDSASVSLSQDTWYEIEIDWATDGTQTATLYDSSGTQLSQLSMTDTTWTSGGVGYDAYLGSGESVYFDYVTIGSSDGDGSSTDSKSPNGPDVSGGGLVVENFEDGDLSEYAMLQDSDDAEIVSDPVFYGSNSLKLHADEINGPKIISTDSLPNYPSAGSTFRCRLRGDTANGELKFLYGYRSEDEYYILTLETDSGYCELDQRIGDTWYPITDFTISFSTDQWYQVEIKWNRDETHKVAIYDENGSQLGASTGEEFNDTATWTSGGVGFTAYSSADSSTSGFVGYIDSYTIEDHDDSGAGVVVDDFEDGDLSEYSFDRGSSGASVISSPTFNGSKALEISGTNTEMIKTTGLPNEPEAGDVFSYWVRGTGGADMVNLTYGVQDHKNRYFVRVNVAEDRLKLYRYEGGSGYLLDKQVSGFTLQEDVWYKVEVDWRTNGRHIVTLTTVDGNVTVEETDATWTKGGIGYDAYVGDGGTVYFDYVTKNKCQPTDAGKVVDDFDDGDLSEYTVVQGSASTTTSPTYFGSNSLEISGTDTELVSTSGLPRYPSAGDRFRARVRATGGASTAKLLYSVQGSNKDERYAITIDFINDDVSLYYENGSTQTLIAEDTTSCILTEDEWFRVEVDWRGDGTQTVSVFNDSEDCLVQISGTDSTLVSGGIGFNATLASSGGTVYFDHVLVDGLRKHVKTLTDQHGEIEDAEVEPLSDNGSNPRNRQTLYFADGTEYQSVHELTDKRKYRITGDNADCWVCDSKENVNQRRTMIDKAENGGA